MATPNATTDNHSLQKWADGQTDWEHRSDMDTIEKRLTIRDTQANRSNYTAHSNALYLTTDQSPEILYEGDGSNWVEVGEIYTTEEFQDAVGAMAGDNLTYDDPNGVLDASGVATSHDDLTDDVTGASDVDNSGTQAIQDLTFDPHGHVTGVTSADVGGSGSYLAEQLGTSGLIVWIADGNNGAIDPGTTTTPVQDAIDAIDATSSRAGRIYLPMGEIQEEGPLRQLGFKTIIGMSAGRTQDTDQYGTEIVITGGDHGIVLDNYGDMAFSRLHNFTLRPSDSNVVTDKSAMWCGDFDSDGSADGGEEENTWGHIRLDGWDAPNEGVIHIDGAVSPNGSPWCWHVDALYANLCTGPLFQFEGPSHLGNFSFVSYKATGEDGGGGNNTLMRTSGRQKVGMNISTAVIWGTAYGLGELELTNRSWLNIDNIEIEPNQLNESGTINFTTLKDVGNMRIGGIHMSDYDPTNVYVLDDAGGKQLGPVGGNFGNDVTVGNNIVSVQNNAPVDACYYWGPSSDVDEGGFTSNNVIPLADLTSSIGVA